MYNSVFTSQFDQHCHRYLWRDCDITQKPDTFVITRVNIGDRPSGAIATVALKKTADIYKTDFPEASSIIRESTYVDDIIDRVNMLKDVTRITKEMEYVLTRGNFKITGWTISGQQNVINIANSSEKILYDEFYYNVKLKFGPEQLFADNYDSVQLSKRTVLSIVNGIFDPIGLAIPFTVRGKILLRKLTSIELRIDWDEPIPTTHRIDWLQFIRCIPLMEEISFPHCVKPKHALGNPSMITFLDTSEDAFGACCYICW